MLTLGEKLGFNASKDPDGGEYELSMQLNAPESVS